MSPFSRLASPRLISAHLIQSCESTPSGERAQDGITTVSFSAGIQVWSDGFRIQALQVVFATVVSVLPLVVPKDVNVEVEIVDGNTVVVPLLFGCCKNVSPIGTNPSEVVRLPTKTSAT